MATTISDAWSWLTIGDSHLAQNAIFMAKNGSSSISISGGLIHHVEKYLEQNNFLGNNISCYFLMVGGNDLEHFAVSAAVVAGRMRNLVAKISTHRPRALIVTGTPIPRGSRTDHGKADWFQSKLELFDQNMDQGSSSHHHFLNDLFVAESGSVRGPVAPRMSLYADDCIHLNMDGREAFQMLLDFVYESVVQVNFEKTKAIVYNGERRMALWKF